MIRPFHASAVPDAPADVCIVGAGPAGLALALTLARDRTTHTVVLESGGLAVADETEELNDGSSVGVRFTGLTEGRRRAFGGTSAAWAGQCRRMEPSDFERRAWIPNSGWPISAAELEPYYDKAETFFGVSNERYDEEIWRRFRVDAARYDPSKLVSAFTVYCPQPRIGDLYRRAAENAPNLTVMLGATATKLITGEGSSRCRGVWVRAADGSTSIVPARAVVLCTGAIEAARLMLASQGPGAQNGLGNERGLVGRYFQDHPNCVTAHVRPSDQRRFQDLYSLLYGRRVRYWPKIALAERVQREFGLLDAVATPTFEFEAGAIAALKTIVRSTRAERQFRVTSAELASLARGAGDVVVTAYRRYALGRSPLGRPTAIPLRCHLEQVPDSNSRITLSNRCDRFGVPLPQVDWRRSDTELRTLRVFTATIADEFRRLRLGEVVPEPWLAAPSEGWMEKVDSAYHHSGTTRMAASPGHGVVDSSCAVFGVPGLYVAGAGVFPIAGYANPTLTIVALAIRLGEHLALRRAIAA